MMDEKAPLSRNKVDPAIFGGKPILRGRRLAVEHVLGMLAAGDSAETILQGYPWLEAEDIRACLLYARRAGGQWKGKVRIADDFDALPDDLGMGPAWGSVHPKA